MFIISIVGQKGGDGKTTLSIGLGVAAARDRLSVAIIDLDPQANATNWKDRREADNPAVISAQASRLKQTIQTAKEYGADLLLIDTPGRSDSAAVEAARVADLVLVPVRPQIFGLETLQGVRNLLRVAGDPLAYVVINGIHPQATKSVETTRKLIEDTFNLKVAPVHLCQRGSYAEAPTLGKTAQEQDPKGKAAEEIKHLYMFTCNFVKSQKSKSR